MSVPAWPAHTHTHACSQALNVIKSIPEWSTAPW